MIAKGEKATCPVCGKEFVQTRCDRKYDSPTCRSVAYSTANPEKRREQFKRSRKKLWATKPELCRVRNAAWVAVNLERVRRKARERYYRNRERKMKQMRRWYAAHRAAECRKQREKRRADKLLRLVAQLSVAAKAMGEA